MKKFILMLVAVLTMSLTSFAQTQTNYGGSSKFLDNTSIGVVGGVETNLYDWNAPHGAVTGIVLNKEITPIFGVAVEGDVNINGLRNWEAGGYHTCGTVVDAIDVYLTPRVNLSNAFFGYKGSPRKFEVELVAGPGYKFVMNNGDNAMLMKTGFNLNYNVNDVIAVTLRPAIVWGMPTGTFNSETSVAQLTAGVLYKFKTSNGTRSFNKANLYNQTEIDDMNEKITEMQKMLDSANATIDVLKSNAVPTTNTTTNVVTKIVWPKVQFKQGSAEITETSMANIYDIADALRESGDEVKITGYASVEGADEFNKILSLKRAEVVKNALVKAGVNPNKVTTVGAGATTKFNPDNLNENRVIIINE